MLSVYPINFTFIPILRQKYDSIKVLSGSEVLTPQFMQRNSEIFLSSESRIHDFGFEFLT